MKKLMILGAMEMHVPLINYAKRRGIHTIVCDYLPQNPGHRIADESFPDSTTDKDAVLRRAQQCGIDGIMTFVSDPAAETAAYVAEKLGLPGNPYDVVKTMSEKDLFRSALRQFRLNAPEFEHYSRDDAGRRTRCEFPVIVKPVDSSGSKGVAVVYDPRGLEEAVEKSLAFSRCGRCVVEEYIEPAGAQLHGDGFVLDGELKFLCLGDHHFDKGSFVPYSTTLPSLHSKEHLEKCFFQVKEFIGRVGFRNGGINVELRISKRDGKAYIIDIGARNGGNFVPRLTEFYSGFDALEAAVKLALGEKVILKRLKKQGFFSLFVLHARQSGCIKSITLSEELRSHIVEEHIYLHQGDSIAPFTGANMAAGVLILKYDSNEEMQRIVDNADDYYSIDIVPAH